VVDDFIMPVITYMLPAGEWRTATWNVGSVKFGVGDFLSAVLNFLIVGLVAWRISRIFIKPAADAPKKNCQYCKESIDAGATRCSHCTSQLAAA
jgi:large conductance mechanosensitive channel